MPGETNVRALECKHPPDHEQGEGFCSPTTRHSKPQQRGALLHTPHVSRQSPVPEKAGGKKYRDETRQGMAGRKSMHLGQACRDTKTNEWKSTSEVTLQDSNLEVYWQRGKRAGLVHSRDTRTNTPPPGTGTTLGAGGRGSDTGRPLHTRAGLASSDISLFKNLYLLEQGDIPRYSLIKISDKPYFVNSRFVASSLCALN